MSRGGRAPELYPLARMRRMMRDFDRFFASPFGLFDDFFGAPGESIEAWSPRVDVFQTQDEIVVRADLPGLKKDDVHVELIDDALVLSGARESEESHEEGGWYRSERSWGRFRRVIPLPEGVNADKARAHFEDGVLEVRVAQPEQQKKKSQRIEIGERQASSSPTAEEKPGVH